MCWCYGLCINTIIRYTKKSFQYLTTTTTTHNQLSTTSTHLIRVKKNRWVNIITHVCNIIIIGHVTVNNRTKRGKHSHPTCLYDRQRRQMQSKTAVCDFRFQKETTLKQKETKLLWRMWMQDVPGSTCIIRASCRVGVVSLTKRRQKVFVSSVRSRDQTPGVLWTVKSARRVSFSKKHV